MMKEMTSDLAGGEIGFRLRLQASHASRHWTKDCRGGQLESEVLGSIASLQYLSRIHNFVSGSCTTLETHAST